MLSHGFVTGLNRGTECLHFVGGPEPTESPAKLNCLHELGAQGRIASRVFLGMANGYQRGRTRAVQPRY